jgi:cytochrome c
MQFRYPAFALSVPLLAIAAPAFGQSASSGATLFKQRCQMCHTVAPGGAHCIGPNLSGVAGRKAASTQFNYSPALTKSGLTWDKATLDKFLTMPSKLVPGTRMVVSIPDAKQRADVVAFLGTQKK